MGEAREGPGMNDRHITGAALAVAFIGTILAANYATTRYGFVPVGFGFEATAGTILVGFTLALRDGIQDTLGRWAVAVLIVVGTLVSFAIAAPQIALASAAAFAFAELLNFAIYTPIRERARFGDRRWALAVGSSNAAGAVADTAIFVGIAFGAGAIMPAMLGQLVGKGWATLAYLLIGKGVAVAVPRQPMRAAGGGSHA